MSMVHHRAVDMVRREEAHRRRLQTARGDEAQPEAAYSYPKRVLESWVPRLLALADVAEVVHAVFRNAHRDFAPRSADRLRRLLRDTGTLLEEGTSST